MPPDRATGERPLSTGLLTVKEAMRLAHVSRRTIYNWIDSGRLTIRRTAGGQPRIVSESLFARRHYDPVVPGTPPLTDVDGPLFSVDLSASAARSLVALLGRTELDIHLRSLKEQLEQGLTDAT